MNVETKLKVLEIAARMAEQDSVYAIRENLPEQMPPEDRLRGWVPKVLKIVGEGQLWPLA
ncbi:MAG TPA: hypothetical protein VJ600_04105 [Holophagaceae bacterium]|nr:hypothetical protein [Holophagaceae bacterium]